MPNVILQPCADQSAFDHFQLTISSDVLTRNIRKYVSNNDWKIIKHIYPDETCRIWGVEPKSGVNGKKWAKIRAGDIAYFSRHRSFIASGTVTMTLQNKDLAYHLWGESENNSTWEYIYFLKGVELMKTPVVDFNLAVGYSWKYPIQGFSVLNDRKSELALEYFGLEPGPDPGYITLGEAALEKKLANLKQTDRKALENQREEQDILTTLLHNGKPFNNCAICQRTFPVSFLITAHIKKRAHCPHDQRIDRYIVMPLCNLGCDQLYERGYVTIKDGIIVQLRETPMSDPMKAYLDAVKDEKCTYFSDRTRLYFEWHGEFHRKNLK